MASVTIERLQSLFLRELAIIVNEERVTDGKIVKKPYYNITEVKITKDLSSAKIYYTILSDEEIDIEAADQILAKETTMIRHTLTQRIKNLRKMPELKFEYDTALAYGNKIDKILKEINKEKSE